MLSGEDVRDEIARVTLPAGGGVSEDERLFVSRTEDEHFSVVTAGAIGEHRTAVNIDYSCAAEVGRRRAGVCRLPIPGELVAYPRRVHLQLAEERHEPLGVH